MANRRFLVTGGAGFIGSALVRELARAGHGVVVLDDLSTGKRENLAEVNGPVELVVGSITEVETVAAAAAGTEGIFHLAAVASVARSLAEPGWCHAVNVTGTLNVLEAARRQGVKRVVLSSSAAVYGELDRFPLVESERREPISPYGLHKAVDEQYARLYARSGWGETVCLRYFNVFGPRQDPNGDYAAVVPKFIAALLSGRQPTIFGDGLQSRDFLFVEDVARVNLAAMATGGLSGELFNVCAGRETNLLQLLTMLGELTGRRLEPRFEAARAGDIRRSFGSDSRLQSRLALPPWTALRTGLEQTVAWHRRRP